MYLLLWIFFIYAFLGWCAEVSWAALRTGQFVNRGFLNGPVCPIYGFGVVIVLGGLMPLRENLFVLFAGSVLLTSALEWLTGSVMEKLFHQRWWDYSDEPFNLGGYVCLRFSLMWGFACLFIVELIHPTIMALVRLVPHTLGVVLLCVFSGGMAVDLAATVKAVVKMNHRLEKIDELAGKIRRASDELGQSLAERVVDLTERSENVRGELEELKESMTRRREELRQSVTQRTEDARENLEELRRKLDELVAARGAGERRLLRAFPTMRSQKYKNALDHLRRRSKEK